MADVSPPIDAGATAARQQPTYWFEKAYWLEEEAPNHRFGSPPRIHRLHYLPSIHLRALALRLETAAPSLLSTTATLALGWWLFAAGSVTLERLGIATAGVALAVAFAAALRPGAVLMQLTVPKALTEAGLTGEVLGARLLDAARDELRGERARSVSNPLEPRDRLPKLEVPGFKLSLDALGDLVRDVVGRRRREITGEVVEVGPGLVSLRLRGFPGGARAEAAPQARENLDALLRSAAAPLLQAAAPYNYAFALRRRENLAEALRVAEHGARVKEFPRRVRARCCLLRWFLLLAMARREDAGAALLEALTEDLWDPLIIEAVGEHIAQDADAPDTVRRFWARASRAATRWTRGQSDLDSYELSWARATAVNWEWKRRWAKEHALVARDAVRRALSNRRSVEDGQFNLLVTNADLSAREAAFARELQVAKAWLHGADTLDPDESCLQMRTRLHRRIGALDDWRQQQTGPRLAEAIEWRQAASAQKRHFESVLADLSTGLDRLLSERGKRISAANSATRLFVRRLAQLRRSIVEKHPPKSIARDWYRALEHSQKALAVFRAAAINMRKFHPDETYRLQREMRRFERLVAWLLRRKPTDDALAELVQEEAVLKAATSRLDHRGDETARPEAPDGAPG